MSFTQKIKQNQSTIIAVLGGLATGYILFRIIRSKPKQETPEQLRRKRIEALRSEINAQNPSYADIKKIIQFCMNQAKIKIVEFTRIFKQKRMRFNKQTRVQNFNEYLNLLYDGLQQMKLMTQKQVQQIALQLGINKGGLEKYQSLFEQGMQQYMQAQTNDISHITPMKLQQAKFAFRLQIDYVKQHGDQLAKLIINAIRNWPQQKIANLSVIIAQILNDCAFEGYPQITTDAFQHAQRQFNRELMGQIQQLQIAIMPMMMRLSQALNNQYPPQGMMYETSHYQAPQSPLFYR